MTEAIINVSQVFERTLTDNQGDFVTGQTITFEVRNSATDALITSGTMTEQNEVYKFSFTFTSLIEARIKFVTPNKFPNDLESVRVVDAPATEDNATTNKNSIITEVDANETKIDAIITTLSTLISDIWSFVTRTLTGIGTSGIASEANATTNTSNIIAEIDANELDLDTVNDNITAHRNEVENKITFILGLSQHNTQIKDTVYDVKGNLISATIKLYANATDAINDTNVTKTYSMVATFNANDQLLTYIVSEN